MRDDGLAVIDYSIRAPPEPSTTTSGKYCIPAEVSHDVKEAKPPSNETAVPESTEPTMKVIIDLTEAPQVSQEPSAARINTAQPTTTTALPSTGENPVEDDLNQDMWHHAFKTEQSEWLKHLVEFTYAEKVTVGEIVP
jgi:hypothetical protein